MSNAKKRQRIIWGVFLLLALLMLACSETGSQFTPTPARSSIPVDSVFKEFYQTLGGRSVLGLAISELEIRGDLKCQFTERALMCYDPAATGVNQFTLGPLGTELGIREDHHMGVVTPPMGAKVIDGFVLYEKFQELYDRLYGARYVGRPLTEMRINPDLNRYEQFFENVGFYQDLNNPNSTVALIPYGSYLCGADCSSRLTDFWFTFKSNRVEQPFSLPIARLGGPSVFGSPLLHPIYRDGNVEHLYTNALFSAPADNPSDVKLRPLPKLLGIAEQPLSEKVAHPELVFYEIADGLGHNVPKAFDKFIANHGGRDLSGDPLMEVEAYGQNLYRQCFENYCLLYDPSAAESMKVRIAPLGQEYMEKFPPPEDAIIRNMFSPENISLLVSTDKPNLNDDEEQQIQVMVLENGTGQPMERVEATLMLDFPDRPTMRFSFSPTNKEGMSTVTIPPQSGVSNGTRLSYQVCLNLPSETPICQPGSYSIWNVKK